MKSSKSIFGAAVALSAMLGIGAASAADLTVKTAPYAPPAFRWTGCQVGAHGGGGWSKNNWSQFGFLPDTEVRSSGWLAGGQLGCDYQIDRWVVGVEGTYSWADMKGTKLVSGSFQDSRRSTIDGIATVTGRVGYAFEGLLPYLRGGAAWVQSKHQSDFIGFGAFFPAYNSARGEAFGWLMGVGIEGLLFSNWTWNIEYNYINLGTNSFALTCNNGAFCFPLGGVGIALPQPIYQEIQLVKLGLNYRFGWPR